jgi:hypothetical protein
VRPNFRKESIVFGASVVLGTFIAILLDSIPLVISLVVLVMVVLARQITNHRAKGGSGIMPHTEQGGRQPQE